MILRQTAACCMQLLDYSALNAFYIIDIFRVFRIGYKYMYIYIYISNSLSYVYTSNIIIVEKWFFLTLQFNNVFTVKILKKGLSKTNEMWANIIHKLCLNGCVSDD